MFSTIAFIKLLFFVVFPVSSFAAGVYFIVSYLHDEYIRAKKLKSSENQAGDPKAGDPEDHGHIICENCKAKKWCVLKNEPKAVKVKVKRRKYKSFHFPYEVVGYNANCKYCVFNRSCSVKGVKKFNSCGRYRERK